LQQAEKAARPAAAVIHRIEGVSRQMGTRGASFGKSLRLAAGALPALLFALACGAADAGDPAKTFGGLLSSYCSKCHNADDWAGSLAFDTVDVGHVGEDPQVWEKTITKLRGRLMPPAGQKQPGQPDVDAFVKYLESTIDGESKIRRIGHVPIQRLNRTEFATTVKALIGVDIDPKQTLPTEIEVEGFNNIAGALAVSPSFMEQYLSAARHAARLAVGEPTPKMAKVTIPAMQANAAQFPLGTRGGAARGGIAFTYVFPTDGEYHFNVPEEDFLDMGLYPRGAENPSTLVILVDGVEVVRKEIGGGEFLDIADRDGPAGKKVILSRVASAAHVKAGRREVVMTYIERARALNNDATGNGFGGPFGGGGRVSTLPIIQTAIEIEGPFSPQGLSMNDSRARIFVCQPKSAAEEKPCAEKIARNLGTQAFRRPVTDTDLKSLLKFYELGRAESGGFDSGVTELVTAVLSSPDFLYRAISTSATAEEARRLSDLELASRLSFFLWNTGPDDRLIGLATAGKLSDPATMKAQVERMLKDPRASTMVENFALAWLNLDELEKVDPIEGGFNAAMRANFETEIRLFLSSVLLENRSVMDLLDADWTFLNESLARQYDVPGVHGPQFRRVQLTNENRFGILGKGAFLLRTSYGDRTSPVLRGAWVLDKLIGTPPAPPPPNVNTDLSVKEGERPTTVRARLEVHRKNPNCNACHGLIDPPGLALENFDNSGRWRSTDAAARAPIDANTVLSSGVKMNGPIELRRYIGSHGDQFPTTVTRRLMMYALNREVEYFDMPQVRQIVKSAAEGRFRFNDLVLGVVNSDAFRHQGPEETRPQAKTAPTVAKNP
jgi:mono/diheme cytochrome c family protein